jgi:hypothetical protein
MPYSLTDLQAIINGGGSVIVSGQVVSDLASLPTQAQLNALNAQAAIQIISSPYQSSTDLVAGHGPNIWGGYAGNSIDPSCYSCVIAGGGLVTFENKILNTVPGAGHGTLMTIGGGYDNQMDSAYPSTISGGAHNRINMATPAASGWTNNLAGYTVSNNTDHSTISGGSFNAIYNAHYAVIGGGTLNRAGALNATVGGGSTNSANGNSSTVAGGATNLASGSGATVGGGSTNNAYGATSTIAGGNTNTVGSSGTPANGDFGTIVGGFSNAIGDTALASYSVVGGRANKANAQYALVHGFQAQALRYGQHVQASGQFAALGDAQTSVHVARVQTTDATVTELKLDGAGSVLTIPNDTTWAFDILVVARNTATDTESAGYRITGACRRGAAAANTSVIGTPTITAYEDVAGWDATVLLDSGGRLKVMVTGEAAKTISWVARVTTAEVTG